MKFPFKDKLLKENSSITETLKDYSQISEIPLFPHPGAFGSERANHIHEGIDLYCREYEEVYSMESGRIVNISIFTGPQVNSPWWNTTWSVMVESSIGVINYGEIKPLDSVTIGQYVGEGDLIGSVVKVLKKDKGRPMNMLHLELYEKSTIHHISGWMLNTEKPAGLLDPTSLLQEFLISSKNKKIPKI